MHGEYRHMLEHRKFAEQNHIAKTAIVTNGEAMRLLPLDHKDGSLIEGG